MRSGGDSGRPADGIRGEAVRGQSEVLGLGLLLLITVVGMTGVVLLGGAALTETKGNVQDGQAELTFQQLDARAATVALGTSTTQRAVLPEGGTDSNVQLREDAGWIRIEVRNETTDAVEQTLANRTLGSLVYTRRSNTLAYQGGGVWKGNGATSTMVSPPEFHYRGATLTLPLILVRGSDAPADEVLLTREGSNAQVFPNATAGNANPIEEGKVTVTVQSDYYRGWGQYFEERTDGEVEYDSDAQTATLELVTPAQPVTVTSAVQSTSASGEIFLSGNGAYTDSYNSSGDGVYANTTTANGTIVTAGDFRMQGTSEVRGTVRAGGDVDLSGTSDADDIEYTGSFTAGGSSSYESKTKIYGVEGADPIDSHVHSKVETYRTANDNDATGAIVDNETNLGGGTAELGAGAYYFERLVLDDETLVLNTTDGDIFIAVRDYVELSQGNTDLTRIEVEGDGVVRMYVAGESPGGNGHFFLDKDAQIHVPDDDSRQFWVYGQRNFEAKVEGSNGADTYMVGVIYAPSGNGGSGSFTVRHADVYGGVVTGTSELDQGGAVHYDQALTVEQPLPPGAKVVPISYLHVSTSTVNVSSP